VVLSGDGGDETFCGYSKYFALNKARRLIEPSLKKVAVNMTVNLLSENSVSQLNKLLPKSVRQTNVRDKFQKFKRVIDTDSFESMFLEASSYVEASKVAQYLVIDATPLTGTNFDEFESLKGVEPLEQMMAIDYQTFMVDDVLTKVDRATMSASLEGREPLLDHNIMEYMARVPVSMKYQNGSGKYLLKKVLYKYVPESFYTRPKSGFQVPLYEWLKTDLRHLLDKYLAYDRLLDGGIFNASLVHQTLEEYFSGQYININEIWFILMFEMWRSEWDV